MIRIVRLKVLGFQRQDRSVEVLFSEDQVSVIYGDNGCGKTTFLKLLFAALNQQDAALREESVQQIQIDYKTDAGIVESVEISLIASDGENSSGEGGAYDWTALRASALGQSSSLSIGIERGVATQPSRIDPILIHKFFVQRREYGRDSRFYPDTKDLAYELSHFLNRNQAQRARNKNEEIDRTEAHVFLKSIQIGNIESLLLEQYRVARNVATEKIQNALFETLASVIEGERGPVLPMETAVREISGALVKNKDRIIEALCSGLMKPDTLLGENARQIEVSDDQTTPYLFR